MGGGEQSTDPFSFMNVFGPLFRPLVKEKGGVNADEQEGMYYDFAHIDELNNRLQEQFCHMYELQSQMQDQVNYLIAQQNQHEPFSCNASFGGSFAIDVEEKQDEHEKSRNGSKVGNATKEKEVVIPNFIPIPMKHS